MRSSTVIPRVGCLALLTHDAGCHVRVMCLSLWIAWEVLAWSSLTEITDESWLSDLDLISHSGALEAHVRIADEGLLVSVGRRDNLRWLRILSKAFVATFINGHVVEAS